MEYTTYSIADFYTRKPLTGGGPGNYAILLYFDDGGVSAYTEAFTYMESKGLHKATVAVFGSVGLPGYVSWEQAIEMYNAGWDIANHADHTDLTLKTQEQCETALTERKNAIDAQGLTRGSRHVSYPLGAYNDTVLAAMTASGMLTGRDDIGMSFDPDSPPNLYILPAPPISGSFSVNTAKSWIDDAVRSGNALILQLHGLAEIPVSPQWSISDFQELIDWIADQGIQLSTISELYTYLTG